jgi:hypothetical protein
MKRIALLVLFLLLAACSDEKVAEKAAKEGITQELNDPASVEYRDVITYSPEAGVYATCGELNAKNQFGAYMGFIRFVALTDVVDGEAQYRDDSSTDEYPLIYGMLELQYCHDGK